MGVNAQYIYAFFKALGWTKNAICAMLGNMQTESTINPGIYENLDSSSPGGFGLVQWTPNTKYKTWADEHGFTDYTDINGQLTRIQYELTNGLQWISTDTFPMSFEEFSKSTKPADFLANVFLYNYERPASLDQPTRGTQALYWFNYLNDDTPGVSDKWFKAPKMKKLLFYYAGIRR